MNKLPEGWQEFKLNEICESISAGGTPLRSKKEYWENGSIPWVKISDIKETYISKIEEKITQEGLKNSSAKLFPKGTLIYSIFATLGAIGILNIEAATNQAIVGIIPKKNIILTKYLFYCLKSEKDKILSKKSHATQDNLNLRIIKEHKLLVPSTPVQQKIVDILEKAEKAKELRKENNKLSDEYLKSIFNEMFLKNKEKFEKYNGNEIFEFSYGKSLPEKDRNGNIYPVYGSNGIVGYHNNFIVKAPGIIIGRKGSIGEINFSNKDFWPIDTTYFITQIKKFEWKFLYYLLKNTPLKEMNKSAAIPGLNRNDVYSIKFIYPPIELQEKFARIVEKVEELKKIEKESMMETDNLFNALMQKAFRGELVI